MAVTMEYEKDVKVAALFSINIKYIYHNYFLFKKLREGGKSE